MSFTENGISLASPRQEARAEDKTDVTLFWGSVQGTGKSSYRSEGVQLSFPEVLGEVGESVWVWLLTLK